MLFKLPVKKKFYVAASILSGAPGGGGGGGGTAFDPANKAAAITLSNGNLTAAGSGGTTQPGTVRTVQSHASSKYYAEFTCNSVSGGKIGIGILNASQVIGGSGNGLGSSSNSVGYYSDSNIYAQGYAVIGGIVSFATGDNISMAVNVGTQQIWWRKNGGLWNASAGADPSTGTGATSFSFLTGAVFIGVECEQSGDTVTANFGATSYAYTAPSGYGNF